MKDLIDRQAAIDAIESAKTAQTPDGEIYVAKLNAEMNIQILPSAEPEQRWIPVTERLPEIHRRVILGLTDGTVMVGFQGEPDCIWQVTDGVGKKIWVYDPEAYTDNVDDLPTAKDCWFDCDSLSGMSYTSVTSLNYREQFPGVVAWMPMPEPYREEEKHD